PRRASIRTAPSGARRRGIRADDVGWRRRRRAGLPRPRHADPPAAGWIGGETLARPRRHKTRQYFFAIVWCPLGYGRKALDLPIRGGAGRNHTVDRIQPLVPV